MHSPAIYRPSGPRSAALWLAAAPVLLVMAVLVAAFGDPLRDAGE